MTTLTAPPNDAQSAREPRDARDARVADHARTGCTLRISRSGDAERTWSLAEGKCTIGSSPRCQICLPAANARPLQCLVALEADAAVVTRWAAGVLLNGREFASAQLAVGDCLSIGPWEITVDALALPPANSPVEAADPPSPPPAVSAESQPPVENFSPATTRPALNETIAFEPLPPVVEETPATSDHEALPKMPPLALETRASAKTIHMGDEAPPALLVAPRRPDCTSSQTFADRLLVQLWTANRLARTRCQALVAAIRDARRLADESAARGAAAEAQAAKITAAQDAQAMHWKTTRVTLEGELSALQTDLAACNAQRDRLAAELATLTAQRAVDSAAHEQSLAALAEAHSAHAQSQTLAATESALQHEVSDLRQQLAERDAQLETLAAERAAAVEALHVLDRQLRFEQDRRQAPAELGEQADSPDVESGQQLEPPVQRAGDPWPFQGFDAATVEPAEAAAEPPASWQTFAPAADAAEHDTVDAPPARDHGSPWGATWQETLPTVPAAADEYPAFESPRSASVVDDDPADAERFEDSPRVAQDEANVSLASTIFRRPEPADLSPPANEEEPPKSEYVPVSFIDRYRDMLDDDGGSDFQASSSRSLLDDEYLSPAQARAQDDPADDADEALEAYMSNLMRRVRGDSPAPGPTLAAQARSTALTPGLLATETAASAPPTTPEPAEPFDLESMKRTPRRPLNLDLGALREIANATARTAIAEHRQKRHVESIITKVIISAMGVAAGAYALFAAPTFDSPWFWAGCLASTASAGLAVQLIVVVRRRLARRRRHLDPQAANEFQSAPLEAQLPEFASETAE